uniref:Alpha/beta fold hydrolase n=1 Tax=Roseihalotalea indica TaxID=2867963 RepID=A0AA49GI16_9BACT|nr:alpha/beta fold hydrolase [Tunicatimonas sp. TK19036]
MDDIRAVMDAVNSEKAILFGHSEGGTVSALFAATYPNRTISLITFGIFAKRKYALWLSVENNIAETAFASPSYFFKCFKKEFGLSPSDVLQQLY